MLLADQVTTGCEGRLKIRGWVRGIIWLCIQVPIIFCTRALLTFAQFRASFWTSASFIDPADRWRGGQYRLYFSAHVSWRKAHPQSTPFFIRFQLSAVQAMPWREATHMSPETRHAHRCCPWQCSALAIRTKASLPARQSHVQ